MYKIVKKEILNENVILMEIAAPLVSKKCEPGQFIILMVSDEGERIPLTIADYNREKGTVTIIFQVVGETTTLLSEMKEGECLAQFAGPLGTASELEGYQKAAVIGGGLGCAIAYPQAKKLHELGTKVDMIAGFRDTNAIILEKEMDAVSENLYVMTDDGSNGHKGLVTDQLRQLLESGEQYDVVIAIGPLVMMKFVSLLTKEFGVKTIVSMNPIMIDGTGMCGGCRVTVGGKIKFACVDGPDFDGHEVDFDEAIRRSKMYAAEEKASLDHHQCRMFKQGE